MPQLLHPVISKDTLKCALHLAKGVEDGNAIGAIIGILYKRKKYTVVICGDASVDPTWARGVCSAIDDELRDIIHERGQRDTTL